MKTTISPLDAQTRTVEATFKHSGVTHIRRVNAAFDPAGKYDASATKVRVEEVARGIATKIELGVITNAADPTPASIPTA